MCVCLCVCYTQVTASTLACRVAGCKNCLAVRGVAAASGKWRRQRQAAPTTAAGRCGSPSDRTGPVTRWLTTGAGPALQELECRAAPTTAIAADCNLPQDVGRRTSGQMPRALETLSPCTTHAPPCTVRRDDPRAEPTSPCIEPPQASLPPLSLFQENWRPRICQRNAAATGSSHCRPRARCGSPCKLRVGRAVDRTRRVPSFCLTRISRGAVVKQMCQARARRRCPEQVMHSMRQPLWRQCDH